MTTITEPGFVFGMDDETYHGDPTQPRSLSSSLARRLTEHVPAKAIAVHEDRKPSPSMNIGKVAHLLALGAGPELIVWEHDGRTKAGKEERAKYAEDIANERVVAVKPEEREQIEQMMLALRAHPEIAEVLDTSEPEVSLFWQEQGAWLRARFDLLGDAPWDYKTTLDSSPEGFAHDMPKYGYHQQADFYLRGLRALDHPAADKPMRFICQEKQRPYLVQIHECDDVAMAVAAALNDRAIDIFAESLAAGTWASYPGLDAEPTELPAWYFKRFAHAIPAHLNPYAEIGA